MKKKKGKFSEPFPPQTSAQRAVAINETSLFLRPCLPAGRESNPRAKVTGNTIMLWQWLFIHKMSSFVIKGGRADPGFVCIPSWWRRAASALGQWEHGSTCISVYTIDVALQNHAHGIPINQGAF